MTNPLFSIIIPVRTKTKYLEETLAILKNQTFKSYEILVITDKISGTANPAAKRNLGAKMAKGEYLAFLDDDSYPNRNWLKESAKLFEKNIIAVCGPCLTPPNDNISQQASGLVWSSLLGSGGAGSYRNQISPPRFVDDFPSVNLIVKKTAFDTIKGFNTHHWPGEDTILCLNLTQKVGKILYHPKVLVYHHRRPVFIPHLQQITRYALHRGNFARIFPQTSLRIGYLLPSLFLIYCFTLPITVYQLPFTAYPLYLYLSLLSYTFFSFLLSRNGFFASLLATISIPTTHLYYGALFIKGYFTPNLNFTPHKIKKNKREYLGG